MAERDPVDDLAGLWARLEAPATGDPDAEDVLDPTTAASVAWMRAAWAALEAPVERTEPRADLHCDRVEESPRPVTTRAVLLLVAAVLLWVGLPRLLPPERDDAPAEDGAVAETVPESMQAGPREHAAPRPPYTPNALERRHGSVRLILLDDPASAEPEDDDPTPNSREADDR